MTLEMVATVETDGIVLLNSMPQGEFNATRYLDEDLAPVFRVAKKRCEVVEVPTRRALLRQLRRLTTRFHNGQRPLLHLDAHGDEAGLRTASGEHVAWEELMARLRTINVVSANNLVVMFACCYSRSAMRNIDPTQTSPYCFAFGWQDVVSNGVLRDRLPAFYRTFLLDGSLDDAVFPGLDVYCAEDEIVTALGRLAMAFLMGSGRRMMIELGTSKGHEMGLELDVARRASKLLSDDVGAAMFTREWNRFLMADHPRNRGRFELPLAEIRELARGAKAMGGPGVDEAVQMGRRAIEAMVSDWDKSAGNE